MKKQLLILFALFALTMGYSQTFVDNFITYQVISSQSPYTVQATDYDFTNGGAVVNIPATVTYNSITYNVTVIGDEAFLGNVAAGEQITSITIPSSVTFIGFRSFQSNLLTNVTIPNSVTQLSNLSFGENPLLTTVTLSNSLTSIPPFSFVSCALTGIIIPDNVTTIGSNAFWGSQLTSVTIPSNVTIIETRAFGSNPLTCVISENATPPSIVTPTGPNTSSDTFFGSRPNINLTIPSGTASAYTTATWTGFNSVAEGLGNTFTIDYITYQVNTTQSNEVLVVDYETTGGTVVNIPETVSGSCTTYNVTEIGSWAFSSKGLTAVTLPNSITVIGNHSFSGNQLTSLSISPNTVTIIGQQSFQSNQITNIVIPNGVTHIEEAAFAQNMLTTIDMADSVVFLGEAVFAGNNITSLNDIIFPLGLTTLPQQFLSNNQLTSLTTPNSITSIGERAFQSNLLTSVTIQNSVTSIGDRAFDSNPLADVYSEALIPPTIYTGSLDTFAADRSTIHLHIPAGTMGAYVTDTGALWTGFNPVTEDALSISEFELLNTIKVINNKNSIEVVAPNSINLKSYTLYNITGARVSTGTKRIISTDALSKGIYILKLQSNKGTVTKKVIIN